MIDYNYKLNRTFGNKQQTDNNNNNDEKKTIKTKNHSFIKATFI